MKNAPKKIVYAEQIFHAFKMCHNLLNKTKNDIFYIGLSHFMPGEH